jgi:RNA polymerase sigma-70 factor (ECF subfamily)
MSREADRRFDRIIEEHGPALRRLAQAYADGAADADDLFQDICFALWRALPSFRDEASERTFAFRIGHNRGLTHRARKRANPDQLDEEIRDRSPGPDSLLTVALTRERLSEAVRRLPETQRQVVLLSLEGMGNGEIAEVLGVTENSVAVRLTRARKGLRELLLARGDHDVDGR